MKTLYKIEDIKVFNVWKSENDVENIVEISPDFYEENGTPIDFNGVDMIYSHTEIDLSDLKESILNDVKENGDIDVKTIRSILDTHFNK